MNMKLLFSFLALTSLFVATAPAQAESLDFIPRLLKNDRMLNTFCWLEFDEVKNVIVRSGNIEHAKIPSTAAEILQVRRWILQAEAAPLVPVRSQTSFFYAHKLASSQDLKGKSVELVGLRAEGSYLNKSEAAEALVAFIGKNCPGN